MREVLGRDGAGRGRGARRRRGTKERMMIRADYKMNKSTVRDSGSDSGIEEYQQVE